MKPAGGMCDVGPYYRCMGHVAVWFAVDLPELHIDQRRLALDNCDVVKM